MTLTPEEEWELHVLTLMEGKRISHTAPLLWTGLMVGAAPAVAAFGSIFREGFSDRFDQAGRKRGCSSLLVGRVRQAGVPGPPVQIARRVKSPPGG